MRSYHCPLPKPHLLCFIFAIVTSQIGYTQSLEQFVERTSIKNISQIIEDAEFAITERNFRIVDRLHIGKAIRTSNEIDFPDYEVILFCSLTYTRKMLELAPNFITYCPLRIAIRDEGKQRVITAALIPQNTSNSPLNRITEEINNHINGIIDFAAKP